MFRVRKDTVRGEIFDNYRGKVKIGAVDARVKVNRTLVRRRSHFVLNKVH